jgi:hypothetical protein
MASSSVATEGLRYRQGARLRWVEVWRETVDGGATWTRLDLAGATYARDVRRQKARTSEQLLRIRSTGPSPAAALEGQAVQLPDETTPSSTGVVVITLDADTATAALPEGWWWTDALVDFGTGEPTYAEPERLVVDPSVTVLP